MGFCVLFFLNSVPLTGFGVILKVDVDCSQIMTGGGGWNEWVGPHVMMFRGSAFRDNGWQYSGGHLEYWGLNAGNPVQPEI